MKTEVASVRKVWLVGYSSVDILRYNGKSDSAAHMRFGGVCTNAARALGACGIQTTLFTPDYTCDLARALVQELAVHNVLHHTLDLAGPLGLFDATLSASGDIIDEEFIDFGLFAKTTPSTLHPIESFSSTPDYLLTCTDLPVDTIKHLASYCAEHRIKFGLIATAKDELPKILDSELTVDLLSANKIEIEISSGERFDQSSAFPPGMSNLVSNVGVVLVTLGGHGAVLFDRQSGNTYLQRVPRLKLQNPVSAGDVLTANLIGSAVYSLPWKDALYKATSQLLNYLQDDYDATDPSPFFKLNQPWRGELPEPERIRD